MPAVTFTNHWELHLQIQARCFPCLLYCLQGQLVFEWMSLHLYLPVFPYRRPSPEQSIDGTMTITGTNIWMDVLFLTADSLYLILLVAKRRYLLLTGTIQSVFFSIVLLYIAFLTVCNIFPPCFSLPFRSKGDALPWELVPVTWGIWNMGQIVQTQRKWWSKGANTASHSVWDLRKPGQNISEFNLHVMLFWHLA